MHDTPTVILTGGNGQLGRLLRRAIPDIAPVRVLTQSRTAGDIVGPISAIPARVPGQSIAAIIHLAAPTPASPNSDYCAAKHLAEEAQTVARRLACPLVHLSSQAVYGPWQGHPFSETDAPAPQSPYAISKRDAELAAPDAVTLRLGNVLGTDQLGRNLRAGGDVTLHRFDDGRGPRRSYIGIGSLARICLDALHLPSGSIYNIAAPAEFDMADIARAYGAKITDAPAEGDGRYLIDVSKAQKQGLIRPDDSDLARMIAQIDEYSEVLS